MKYVLMAAIVLTLAGCKEESPTTTNKSNLSYKAECIEGVEYWVPKFGAKGYMAPRIDPENLAFVRCEVK